MLRFGNCIARNIVSLVLVISHDLILIVKNITFKYLVKDQPKLLMIALVKQKESDINFGIANTRFCLSLHYNGDETCLHVTKTKIYKFKANDNIFNNI